MGRGTRDAPSVDAWIVANARLPAAPRHKQNAGTRREREARAKAHAQPLARKGRRCAPPSARAKKYAPTWVVFTTAPTVAGAVAIEETFRDWHHRRGWREAAAALTAEAAVARMVGIVGLADRLQVELGLGFSPDPRGRARRAQWTDTDRVSYFRCAQQLLTDPGADWTDWLAQQWDHLITPPPFSRSRRPPNPNMNTPQGPRPAPSTGAVRTASMPTVDNGGKPGSITTPKLGRARR
jgi:hypothetical protein